MRSTGTNRSRPPIRAFSPVTGGYPPSARRTIRSSTRPSRSPARSSSGLRSIEERCTTGGGNSSTTLRLRPDQQRGADPPAEIAERGHVHVRRPRVGEQVGLHRLGDARRVGVAEPHAEPAADDHALDVEQVHGRGHARAERDHGAVDDLVGELVVLVESAGPHAARQARAIVLLHQLEEVCLAPLLDEPAGMLFHRRAARVGLHAATAAARAAGGVAPPPTARPGGPASPPGRPAGRGAPPPPPPVPPPPPPPPRPAPGPPGR